MRYWFHTEKESAFALDVPPPDGQDIVEISADDYREILAAQTTVTITDVKIEKMDPTSELVPSATVINHTLDMQRETLTTPLQEGKTLAQSMDMQRLARIWRKMDAAMDKLKADCEAEVQKIKVQQDQLSAVLLGEMNRLNADKLATEDGVINRKEEQHANASDWGAIWRFIVENQKFEMVQKRLTTTEVLKWAKAHATKGDQGQEVLTLPPGISLFSKYKISVSKPTGRKALPTDEGTN